MEAKFSRRACAYIMDIIVISVVFALICLFIPMSKNINVLNVELDALNETFLNKELTLGSYFNHYSEITYNLDKEKVIYTLINAVLFIGYFAIIPYFCNGQTLGKKVWNIKITKENGKPSLNDLIIRNLIVNSLGLMLISLALLFVMPPTMYVITTLFLGVVQIIIIIIIAMQIIKSKDHIGWHDKITNTKVVNL